MTLQNIWLKAQQHYAQRPCIGFVEDRSWTYSELGKKITTLQHLFKNWDIQPNARVALWATNQPYWSVVYLATTTASLTIVPLLVDLHPREVACAISHSETSVLFIGQSLKSSWENWIQQESPDLLKRIKTVVLEDLERLLSDVLHTQIKSPYPAPQRNTLAGILYTSGTTGSAKGVMLTHNNIASNVLAAAPLSGLKKGNRCLSVLPLAHTYECSLGLLLPLFLGMRIYYLNKMASPAILAKSLSKVRPHLMLVVPIFIEKIYRRKVLPLLQKKFMQLLTHIPVLGNLIFLLLGQFVKKTFGGKLKFFGIGGAPLAPEVESFLKKIRFPYAVGYGLTETSPLVTGSRKATLFSTGPIVPGVEVLIAKTEDESMEGEILVKGPNVTLGYYKDPQRTAEVFTQDGWFRTGDLGYLDRNGHLFIKGRLKNLILGPNGENIYPEAIEALINQKTFVLDSLVLQRGGALIAKVVLNYEAVQSAIAKWSTRKGRNLGSKCHYSTFINEYLDKLTYETNKQLSRFCRLHFIEEHQGTFEKTPTLKTKRYLYS